MSLSHAGTLTTIPAGLIESSAWKLIQLKRLNVLGSLQLKLSGAQQVTPLGSLMGRQDYLGHCHHAMKTHCITAPHQFSWHLGVFKGLESRKHCGEGRQAGSASQSPLLGAEIAQPYACPLL